MNEALHIDFETRSTLDLRKVGLHRYARDPSTDVWCMAGAVGDEEPKLSLLSDSMWIPPAWAEHIKAGRPVYAHNSPFELDIWNQICGPRYGWPELKPEQTFCTMATSYAMGLPGALEDVALALGLRYLKDTLGHAIMLRACRPWKTDPDGTVHWLDECPKLTIGGVTMTGKEALARLFEYCRQDVRVEREVHSRVMPLSARERAVWLLDYKINQRGARIDVDSVKAAVKLAETVKENAGEKLAKLTGGAVQSATALPAIKEWLAANGCKSAADGLAKQEVIDLLALSDLPYGARAVLTLRQEVGKASTAKFDTMLERVGEDGRIHDMYQYHGAATGRWAGRGVQTHNLVRDMPPAKQVEHVLQLIREGQHEAIDLIYGPPLTMTARCMRSFFVPKPDGLFVTGDWANVEGRGQAWFSGEDWKIKAFIAADRKEGPGIYELAYSRMFGVPVESVKNPSEERQIGKVCLTGDTEILTDRGTLNILDVTTEDRVWDGVEWVQHSGLLRQGYKATILLDGVGMTPTHRVLTPQGWAHAETVASSASALCRALALASESLPSSAQCTFLRAGSSTPWFSVLAAQFRTAFGCTTYSKAGARTAKRVPRNRQATGAKIFGHTQTLCPTTRTADDCSTEYRPASIAAIIRTTGVIRTMAGAAFTSTPLGMKTGEHFSRILSRWTDGMKRILSLIEKKLIAGTNPATYASCRAPSMPPTGERSKSCSGESKSLKPVFDLADAGPRRRFTVKTDSGWLVVHNCELAFGYQGGVGSFQKMGKNYNVKVKDADADNFKVAWRAAHPRIVKTWRDLENAAINAVRNPGQAFSAGYTGREATYKVVGSFLWCKLPSQRVICYPYPKLLQGEYGPQLTYMTQPSPEDRKSGKVIDDPQNSARWVRVATYGGSLFNNVIQGMCRDFLAECMLALDAAGAAIVLHTHDSIALEVARFKAEVARKAMNDFMLALPAWAKGFPLFAECEIEERFRG